MYERQLCLLKQRKNRRFKSSATFPMCLMTLFHVIIISKNSQLVSTRVSSCQDVPHISTVVLFLIVAINLKCVFANIQKYVFTGNSRAETYRLQFSRDVTLLKF